MAPNQNSQNSAWNVICCLPQFTPTSPPSPSHISQALFFKRGLDLPLHLLNRHLSRRRCSPFLLSWNNNTFSLAIFDLVNLQILSDYLLIYFLPIGFAVFGYLLLLSSGSRAFASFIKWIFSYTSKKFLRFWPRNQIRVEISDFGYDSTICVFIFCLMISLLFYHSR